MFSEYEHMLNHYNVSFNKFNIEWIATEKIHGTNYSFLLNKKNKEVIPCKRTSILESDSNFYNHNNIFNKYKGDIIILFDILSNIYPNLLQIQVYGELFGGLYNGKTSSNSVVIQKKMNYNIENDFLAFDIKITLLNNSFYLDWDDFIDILSKTNIKHVPIIKRGSLESLMTLNPKFESVVYKIYNLPELKQNYAEGYVIKSTNKRFIFKYKNPMFAEVSKKHVLYKTKSNGIGDVFKKYITINRYDNIISKKLCDKDFLIQEIIQEMINDIIIEYLDDNNNIECDIEKIKKILDGMVSKFIKNIYLK